MLIIKICSRYKNCVRIFLMIQIILNLLILKLDSIMRRRFFIIDMNFFFF